MRVHFVDFHLPFFPLNRGVFSQLVYSGTLLRINVIFFFGTGQSIGVNLYTSILITEKKLKPDRYA